MSYRVIGNLLPAWFIDTRFHGYDTFQSGLINKKMICIREGRRWTPLGKVESIFLLLHYLFENVIPGGILLETENIYYNNAIPGGIVWFFVFVDLQRCSMLRLYRFIFKRRCATLKKVWHILNSFLLPQGLDYCRKIKQRNRFIPN